MPVEISPDAGIYSIYLDQRGEITPALEMDIVQTVEASPSTLVRFGAWPDGSRSALSITGDIDAMTLVDFMLRLWEAR